jgi:hypothetical protein
MDYFDSKYEMGASGCRVSVLTVIVRIEKAAGTQFRHDFRKAGAGDSEAAFAATEHAEMTDHFVADVPGAVHDNPSREGVVIGRVQSLEPNRMAMAANIGSPRPIGPGRARVRAWLVGEALQPPGTQGVGASPMRDQMRTNAAVSEPQHVEPWPTRGPGEIRDADKVPVGDAVAVSVQRIERALTQGRGHEAAGIVRLPEGGPSDRRGASQTGQRETEEMTTGKGQDVKFRYPSVGAYAPTHLVIVQCVE